MLTHAGARFVEAQTLRSSGVVRSKVFSTLELPLAELFAAL